MKRLLIIPLLVLFVASNSFGTEFPLHKYKKWIAKGKYAKAQKKIEEQLLVEPEYSEDYAELWFYRGSCYSLSYFDDIYAIKTFDEKAILETNLFIEEALYSYKKAYRSGDDDELKRKVVAQMTKLQRFFKSFANRYQRVGNYNQYYINARRARTCNIFLVNESNTSNLDSTLLVMLADAAELAGHKEEALYLRNNLIKSGYIDADLYSNTVDLYLERGDEIRALGTLDVGMKLHPKSKVLFEQKLALLKKLNMEHEAATFLKANIKKYPAYKGELAYLGGMEMQKKYILDVDSEDLFADIEKNFRKAVRINPENEEYIEALANLYYKKALRIKSEDAPRNKKTEKEYVQLLGKARTTISTALKLGQGNKRSLTNALQFVNSENASMVD